jgi:p-hydroxybenzoate 3-monooxygenase
VLEQATVDLLGALGVDARLKQEGLVHHGVELRFDGQGHRIDLSEHTGGRAITIYGQQEVVKDLIAAYPGTIHFEHEIAHPDDLGADIVAGCDGFHGACRPAIEEHLTIYEHEYPFAWLGILVDRPPLSDELIYCNHERGFALASLRSPRVTRLYLQVDTDATLDDWPDDRIWEELATRFGMPVEPGPIFERGITPMRSFVVEPMQHGTVFLAGDAAHIVPPTGAKGLNLAVADVVVLAAAIAGGDLDTYSERCLTRVWRAQQFAWWMTEMFHRFGDDDGGFHRRLQLSQLQYTVTSQAAATSLAENYVGLPHA